MLQVEGRIANETSRVSAQLPVSFWETCPRSSLSPSLSLSLCEVMFEDQAREVGWRKSGLDKTLKFAISTALDWIKCFAFVLKLRLYLLSLTLSIFFFETFRIILCVLDSQTAFFKSSFICYL